MGGLTAMGYLQPTPAPNSPAFPQPTSPFFLAPNPPFPHQHQAGGLWRAEQAGGGRLEDCVCGGEGGAQGACQGGLALGAVVVVRWLTGQRAEGGSATAAAHLPS